MASLLSEEMGPQYAEVVRKCLDCNFGLTRPHLEESKMQEVFFRDVVCKLEDCVRQFEDLSLSD
jgi:hypothetical protein